MCFHFSVDRHRFIVAHGVLRLLLAGYLKRDANDLGFITNEFGKPSLVSGQGEHLKFNLSHSHSLGLFAFARNREIGVDVERVQPEFAALPVARYFFAPEEVSELQLLDPKLRVAGFFNCWTRKESYIKARGMGLSLSLDSFQVSLSPGSPAVLMRDRSNPAETRRWQLRHLSPAAGYVASIAVEGTGWRLRQWQWSSGLGSPRNRAIDID